MSEDAREPTRQNLIVVLLIGAAMVLGGGGSPAPAPEIILQLVAAGLFVAWVIVSAQPMRAVPRDAWVIAGLLVLIPVIQLLPLPPALWHALPGREAERAALALVGAEDSWRPWSIAPARTVASLLAVAVPAALVLMGSCLTRGGRTMAIGMVAAVAFASLLVGTGQLTGGESNALRYYVKDAGYLNGFQANHNSAADVLLIGMIAYVATLRVWSLKRPQPPTAAFLLAVAAGGVVLFSVGVFLTASRAGTILLPLAWLASLVIAWPWVNLTRRGLIRTGIVALVGAIVLAVAFLSSGMVTRVVGRFAFEGEFRPQLWQDTLFAAKQYFPFGSGNGTFVPAFVAIERLEVVDPTFPNRAHNDGLEFLLESGVFGVVAVVLVGGILTRRILSGWREAGSVARAQIAFAAGVLAIIAAHSQVDYPLRSMSLACIAALAASLLMPGIEISRQRRPDA